MRCTTPSILFIAAGILLSGCSGKNDDAGITPPPPPSQPAQINLSQAAPATAAPGAPQAAQGTPEQAVAAPLPPPTTDEGLAAITKGLTPEEIKEFKENATIEKFDTNIQMLQEAENSYYNEYKKSPPTVEAMVAAGFLSRKPIAPKGKKYVIDQQTGAVSSINE